MQYHFTNAAEYHVHVLQPAEKDGSVKTEKKSKADEKAAAETSKKGKGKKGGKATPKVTRPIRGKAAKEVKEDSPEVCSQTVRCALTFSFADLAIQLVPVLWCTESDLIGNNNRKVNT